MSLIRAGLLTAGLIGCTGPETSFETLEPILSVAPPSLDLGEVGVSLSATDQVFVKNAGKADLSIEVALEDPLGAFALEGATGEPPTLQLEIEPGEEVPLAVTFTPETFRGYDARLAFASNDEERPSLSVPLHGTGIDLPLPVIEIEPGNTLQFVDVQPGEEPIQFFEIRNLGDAELVLGEMTLEGDTDRFALVLPPPEGTTIFPGDSRAVPVKYSPDDSDGEDVTIHIPSNDPVAGEVLVLVVGNGGSGFDPPVAVIDCPETVLLTGPEWAHLDGSGSSDPLGGELTYQWTVLSRPPGSDGDIPVDPDDQPEADVYVDLAGLYTVQLVVKNALDTPSVPALCVMNAVPEDDIHVELSWDTPSADVDLHLAQGAFPLFATPEDCNWCNQSPDWGAGGNNDDPRLDIDDRGGFGPENINVLVPAEGDYQVRVHYFSAHGDGPLVATVRVWAGGTEIAVEQRVMQPREVWSVGTVGWPAGSFAVDPAPNTTAAVTRCQ